MHIVKSMLACAGLMLAVPAAAAGWFTVTTGASNLPITTSDDFLSNLNALGLTNVTHTGASISLAIPRRLKFDYMGSESGFTDTFTAQGSTFTETNKAVWGPTLMFSKRYGAGNISDWFFDASASGGTANAGIGNPAFGIYTPGAFRPGGTFSRNVLYLGFDDQLSSPDNDHDDFIVRVTAVPEPDVWAMLIVGFGLVGAAHRRRRLAVTA